MGAKRNERRAAERLGEHRVRERAREAKVGDLKNRHAERVALRELLGGGGVQQQVLRGVFNIVQECRRGGRTCGLMSR
jgi:hypothetical protein